MLAAPITIFTSKEEFETKNSSLLLSLAAWNTGLLSFLLFNLFL